MRIGNGKHVYEWIDGWAKIPDTESARTGFAHSDMVVTGGGELITFHPGDPELLAFDKDGNLLRSSTTGLTNAHGIAIVQEGEAEYLWLADDLSGQVVKTTLDGRTVLSLERPELAIYQAAAYSPTSVAVNEERHGATAMCGWRTVTAKATCIDTASPASTSAVLMGKRGGRVRSSSPMASGSTPGDRSRSCTSPTG